MIWKAQPEALRRAKPWKARPWGWASWRLGLRLHYLRAQTSGSSPGFQYPKTVGNHARGHVIFHCLGLILGVWSDSSSKLTRWKLLRVTLLLTIIPLHWPTHRNHLKTSLMPRIWIKSRQQEIIWSKRGIKQASDFSLSQENLVCCDFPLLCLFLMYLCIVLHVVYIHTFVLAPYKSKMTSFFIPSHSYSSLHLKTFSCIWAWAWAQAEPEPYWAWAQGSGLKSEEPESSKAEPKLWKPSQWCAQ